VKYTLWERKLQRKKSSMEWKFPRSFVPGSESSREGTGQGMNWPGANGPGIEISREWTGQGAKEPQSELARVLLANSLQAWAYPERIGLGAKRLIYSRAKLPIGPWPIYSPKLSFLGPFTPWPIRSLAFSLPGTFARWNFWSLLCPWHWSTTFALTVLRAVPIF